MAMRTRSACGPMEPLEGRVMLAANPLAGFKQAEALTRVSGTLLALHDAVIAGQRADRVAQVQHLRVDAGERVGVTVRATDVAKVTNGLAALGFVATASF